MKGPVLLLLNFILFGLGIATLGFWLAGSHGHLQFRPWMTEDWIMASLLLMGFGVPLWQLVHHLRGGRKAR